MVVIKIKELIKVLARDMHPNQWFGTEHHQHLHASGGVGLVRTNLAVSAVNSKVFNSFVWRVLADFVIEELSCATQIIDLSELTNTENN